MVAQNVFHKASSHQIRDLWRFADKCNIPWNLPTNFHLDQIATIQQRCLLLLCALLFRQFHLFLICVVLTYNNSRKDLHRTCQILGNCQYQWLSFSSSAPGTSSGSSGSPGKFLFYMGRIVTTAFPNRVPPRHIDDCSAIHFLHWILRSAAIKSAKFSTLGMTALARPLQDPCYFRLQADIAIWVLRKVRVDTMLTRTWLHFCSRLHW